jgi:hypothetical protein
MKVSSLLVPLVSISLLGLAVALAPSVAQEFDASNSTQTKAPITGATSAESTGELKELKLPRPQAVIERYIQFSGGFELLGSMSSIHTRATATYGGTELTFESYNAGNGRYRETYYYPSGQIFTRQIQDGIGWEGYAGQPIRRYEGDELRGYVRRTKHLTRALAWMDESKSIECSGIEDVNGSDAYRLDFVNEDGSEFSKFFDVESGRLVRTLSSPFYRGAKHEHMSEIVEQQVVDDVVFAKTLKITRDATVYIYKYTDIEVDAKIPKGMFELPPEISLNDDEKKDALNEIQRQAQVARRPMFAPIRLALPAPRVVRFKPNFNELGIAPQSDIDAKAAEEASPKVELDVFGELQRVEDWDDDNDDQ